MLSSVTEHIQAWITAKIPWGLLSQASTPKFFLSVALAVLALLTWFAVRSATAIVGEYAKRFWFRRIHPDKIAKNNVATTHAINLVESIEAEFDTLAPEISTLIKALDDVHKNYAILEDKYTFVLEENAQLRKRVPADC